MKKFVEKLQNLSETKRKIIFFAVMGISAFAVGFVGVQITVRNLPDLADSGKLINLPKVELPFSQIAIPSVDFSNVSPSDSHTVPNQNNPIK